MHTPEYHIKFKDNRTVIVLADNIQAKDETDMAPIPIKPEDFLEQTKSLTKEGIHHFSHPLPLNS